jgi:YD repeat-containing protein
MTTSAVKAMLVSLSLVDTPVGYHPPLGPGMDFTVRYNQREIAQPATFTYANLGPNWTFDYLSYVTPNSAYASVYERGGGLEIYYTSGTNTYYPNQRSQAVLTQVNSTTWQRTLPSGEVETFGQPDGSGDFFLTAVTDPQGNSLTLSYDSNFRLVALYDALNQKTTITYASQTPGNVGFYNITKVTDPFGRYAQFAYDTSGRLQSITDVLNISSQFTYSGATTFVNSLTTPYGVTSFSYGDNSTDPSLGTTRWLQTTYPDGNATRTEYNESQNPSGVSGGADANGIPYGMYAGLNSFNSYMQYRNTYYWDKQAMKSYAGNYAQAEVTHWLHTSDINTCSDVEESIKKVDQNRIWYAYGDGNPGQISSIQASNTMIAKPTQKGRVMGTGTSSSSNTQLFQYQYNTIGKVTKEIGPTVVTGTATYNYETDYTYYPNNIDLYQVEQKNPSSSTGYDLLATYTYNTQHEVLTATDASGQETQYVYYPNGQLNYTINALGQKTTYGYTNNYLTSITGPVSGASTSFTYDGFGRVRTVKDSQGYTTTTNYDAMDRPTLISYPDGTTSQINYQNLDVQYTRDRLGHLTRYFYNSVRQPIEAIDSLGHITTSNWTLSAGLGSVVDPSGNTTFWKYDNQNRPVEKDYPDGTKQMMAYESTTSRVLSVTDNKGQVATNTYNMDNTVAQVAYTNATVATPTVSYSYDPAYPRVHTMMDGTGTTTYNYNSVPANALTSPTVGANLLSSIQTPLATISYSSAGRARACRIICQTLFMIPWEE